MADYQKIKADPPESCEWCGRPTVILHRIPDSTTGESDFVCAKCAADPDHADLWQPEVVGPMVELRDRAIEEHRAGKCEPMDDLFEDEAEGRSDG